MTHDPKPREEWGFRKVFEPAARGRGRRWPVALERRPRGRRAKPLRPAGDDPPGPMAYPEELD